MADTTAPTTGRGRPEGFGGGLLGPGDPAYDEARIIFNAMIDKRPALIAQCETVDDVRAAVRYGVAEGLEIAVRSGGHSVAGAGLTDGGLVVDLRRLNAAEVDPAARTIRVGGGATWADFDRACQPHGLATTGGRVSTTGVAGLALGGGSGWFERKFGLSSDSLLAVELVTADGLTVTASEDENPDLFWALHGGGGNFGVATSLTFRLNPLPVATLGLLLWPATHGLDVTRAYRDLAAGAPDGFGGGLAYLTGPPEEFVVPHLQGTHCVAVIATLAGSEPELRELIAPLLAMQPESELIAELPYAELQSALDDPPGYRNYWSVEHLSGFGDDAVELFCKRAADMVVPSPSQHLLAPWGGAVGRDAGDWPQPHRGADWVVHPLGLWEDPADDERAIAWARGLCADLKPFSTGAVYLNFTGDEGHDRVVAGYGEANYRRLATIKGEYDPDNVFHLNQNIQPSR